MVLASAQKDFQWRDVEKDSGRREMGGTSVSGARRRTATWQKHDEARITTRRDANGGGVTLDASDSKEEARNSVKNI